MICGEISVMWFRFVLSWTLGGGGNGTHMAAHVHKHFFLVLTITTQSHTQLAGFAFVMP